MKTVVFLHPHFLKPAGASKVVLEFAYRLQKYFNVKIITIRSNPNVISPYPGLDIINLGGPITGSIWFWLTFPMFFKKLKNAINQIPDKIVFAHSLAIYWTLFLPNSVIYFHDLGFPYSDSNAEKNSLPFFYKLISYLTNPIFQILNNKIIKSKNVLIANSPASNQYILNKYHRQPNAIITPGINIQKFQPSDHKENYFFTVGRLEKIKQIDSIIIALALYNNPKYRLKIVGEGVEKYNLLKLSQQLKIDHQIDFLGKQTPSQIAHIASHAKIGIFNCPYESFGLSILESLASGTPIITVNRGGGAFFVDPGKNGYLSDGTPQSIAKLIPKLLIKSFSVHSRSSALIYDWNIQTKQLSQFLSSLN